jgi:hypothetical protein
LLGAPHLISRGFLEEQTKIVFQPFFSDNRIQYLNTEWKMESLLYKESVIGSSSKDKPQTKYPFHDGSEHI